MRPRGNAPIESSGIVNSGTGKQPGLVGPPAAALPSEGELSSRFEVAQWRYTGVSVILTEPQLP